DGGDRVSAAADGGGVVIACDRGGDGVGAVGESRHLENAHGTVPDDGTGFADLVFEEGDGLGADVKSHKFSWKCSLAGEDLRLGVDGELVREDVVDREEEA